MILRFYKAVQKNYCHSTPKCNQKKKVTNKKN